jgi:uncharacterized protein YjbI with pentapeptide repeats
VPSSGGYRAPAPGRDGTKRRRLREERRSRLPIAGRRSEIGAMRERRWQRMTDVFEQQVAAADQEAAALARTIEAGDRPRSLAIAGCLRAVIDRLDRTAVLIVMTRTGPAEHRAVSSELRAIHDRAQPLLAHPLLAGAGAHPRRFIARLPPEPLAHLRVGPGGTIDASGAVIAELALGPADLSQARLAGATLRDLDAHGANLDRALAAMARLSNVRLSASSARRANLRSCLATDCDFTCASLQATQWHDATALRCCFIGASLKDLCAERATFIDCDFRGADLGIGHPGARAAMAGARFLRCDLRWTSWGGRALAGISFVGCKLHGVRGRPNPWGMIVTEADLSFHGDGSIIGDAREVRALWEAAGATPVSAP